MRRVFFKTQPKRVNYDDARLLEHPNAQVRISIARFLRSVAAPLFKHFSQIREELMGAKSSTEQARCFDYIVGH